MACSWLLRESAWNYDEIPGDPTWQSLKWSPQDLRCHRVSRDKDQEVVERQIVEGRKDQGQQDLGRED